MVFVLEFEHKSEGLLVERWMKAGDTKGKRKAIQSALSYGAAGFASQQALQSARKWREATCIKNSAGLPERGNENAV